jgi:hypothetical protein
MRDVSLPILSRTSIWPDGKETKVVVQQTASEAIANMRHMSNNVDEVKSS